jgi:ribosomal-protein-alanine N-acetyltransferase
MSVTAAPWSSMFGKNGHILVQLQLPLLTALSNGDLNSAQAVSENQLTPYIISPSCRAVWKMRLAQIEANPADALWVTRLVIDAEAGAVVGRAGFHGPPDENGMVEVGYSIDPNERRKGHARAALTILLDVARRDEKVKVVRASVRPDNVASRSLIDQHGFKEVGEQWDDVDGLEIILEVSVE